MSKRETPSCLRPNDTKQLNLEGSKKSIEERLNKELAKIKIELLTRKFVADKLQRTI